MGGLHLSGANEAIIPQTVEAMAEFKLATDRRRPLHRLARHGGAGQRLSALLLLISTRRTAFMRVSGTPANNQKQSTDMASRSRSFAAA